MPWFLYSQVGGLCLLDILLLVQTEQQIRNVNHNTQLNTKKITMSFRQEIKLIQFINNAIHPAFLLISQLASDY